MHHFNTLDGYSSAGTDAADLVGIVMLLLIPNAGSKQSCRESSMQASLPLPQPSSVPAPCHPSVTFSPLSPLKTVTMQHGLPAAQDACPIYSNPSHRQGSSSLGGHACAALATDYVLGQPGQVSHCACLLPGWPPLGGVDVLVEALRPLVASCRLVLQQLGLGHVDPQALGQHPELILLLVHGLAVAVDLHGATRTEGSAATRAFSHSWPCCCAWSTCPCSTYRGAGSPVIVVWASSQRRAMHCSLPDRWQTGGWLAHSGLGISRLIPAAWCLCSTAESRLRDASGRWLQPGLPRHCTLSLPAAITLHAGQQVPQNGAGGCSCHRYRSPCRLHSSCIARS